MNQFTNIQKIEFPYYIEYFIKFKDYDIPTAQAVELSQKTEALIYHNRRLKENAFKIKEKR